MTLIVNLSTIHDYSIQETVWAFVELCNQSNSYLNRMPSFFKNAITYGWVMAQYYAHYTSLIEPYKLGHMSTEQFLEQLAKIFNLNPDSATIKESLAKAWSSSIKLKKDRLNLLLEKSETDLVYLMSNTNALDAQAILKLLKEQCPQVPWLAEIDLSPRPLNAPIHILPNISLCLSYHYGAFKTPGLLEQIANECHGDITLVSQHAPDLIKGQELGFKQICSADQFYSASYLAPTTSLRL
jgi:hypothetical protein